MRLYLDFETCSLTPIRRGTDVYLDDATPLLATYAFDEGPVDYHDFTIPSSFPLQLLAGLNNPNFEIWNHNSFFDRNVLIKLFGLDIPIERFRCSMAQSLAHGLPGGLDALCEVLGVPTDQAKIKNGHRLILKFCCKKEFVKDEEWPLFIQYAKNDITAMRECVKRMPSWNYPSQPEELRLWHVDQIINNRGFAVDAQLAAQAVKALSKEKERLDDATWIATCGSVSAATQRDKLLQYLCEQQGCVLMDLRAPTISAALEDESLEEATKSLLRIRLEASKTSVSKFKRLVQSVGKGNRLRGTMQYSGAARTARWAGRIFQPHNLTRPTMQVKGEDPNFEIRQCIEWIRNGEAEKCKLLVPLTEAASNSLRGLIVAPEGKTLNVADYSAVEGCVNAWLAGEDWKVKAFKEKKDIYTLLYEKSFGLPAGSVGKKDPRRQIGKVCLSGESLVLCESGWKRLDAIQIGDRVWDGDGWTKHGGLVCNGWKTVVSLSGLLLTPDHQVWCGTTWRPASSLADSSDSMNSALVSAVGSLSSRASYSVLNSAYKASSLNATVAGPNTWLTRTILKTGFQPAATFARNEPLIPSTFSNGQQRFHTLSTGAVYSIASQQRLQDADLQSKKSKGGIDTAVGELSYMRLGAPIVQSFCDMFRRLKGGMIQLWKWIVATITETMSQGISASAQSLQTTETGITTQSCEQKSLVYDLLSVGPKNRFLVLTADGPILVHNCELALGYGGGVGAFLNLASAYGMDLDELGRSVVGVDKAIESWEKAVAKGETYGLSREVYTACDTLKIGYRQANPAITASWYMYENAVREVINRRDPNHKVHVGLLTFDCNNTWLRIKLPSGRFLCYALPRIEKDGTITYMSWRNKRWSRTKTYGGKLCENIVQAVARDLLAHAILLLHDNGYEIVLHIHDEVIAEVLKILSDIETFIRLVSTKPRWAPGLPLSAEGFESERYEKR